MKPEREETNMINPLLKTARIAATAVLINAGALPPQAAMAQAQPGTKRTDLQRHDLGTTGREAIQVRVDFAPGAAFGRHKHPGEEIIYVLEGTLEYQVEGRPPVTLEAGEVFFVPAGTIHAARNVGSTNAAELATYVVEKDKPLVTLVK
jgi:quercetin dioxygenase-like cupin family protein